MSSHDIVVPVLWVLLGVVLAGLLAMLRGLPKKWVDTWIEDRFKSKQDELNRTHQERLSQLNHEYQTKLEAVRSEIQRTFNRVSKVHEKEYEVLPEAWFLLQTAFGTSSNLMNRFMHYIRFATMSDAELDEFLATQPFSDTQKQQIRDAPSPDAKQAMYFKAAEATGHDQMMETQRVLRNYVIAKSVFMSKKVFEGFDAVSLKLIQVNTRFASKDEALKGEGYQLLAELQKDIEALLSTIQSRLYVDGA
jgi:hypothetical protein